MDDIYGDLENYNDENAFEELKGENSDLKHKLQDYELKHAILQEEFDQLAAEFKKLEMNYSSLLKTARAEVARKAQIIATLNAEKDMMILSAIQNSNKSIHVLRRNMRDKSSNRKSRRDEIDPSLVKKEKSEIKRYDPGLGLGNRERIEEKRLPSADTVSSGNSEDTNAIEIKLKKLASYDIEESKENIAQSKRAQSLKHRRKSMPVLSKQSVKFSSDEDDNCSTEDHQRERPVREDKSRKTFGRQKLSHKISETSGIDEKYSSYHESSKDTYYKGNSYKYTDKYRNIRDKYESRHKRHYSPERRRRGAREYPEESLRPELPRHRVLESPPVERYDSQRWFRERRTIPERNDSQDEKLRQETNLHRQERLGKHKSTSDYDEPSNKRARKSSCTQTAKEEIACLKDIPVVVEKLAPEFADHLINTSCQSPDYSHHDGVPVQPKEIMNTAATKLEDPRLQSIKYIKRTDGDKMTLSTVSGRNLDLKLIDTSTWDIERVEIPKALLKPPDYKDESAQDLYNVDNPLSNMSAESGEIHSESNDMYMTDYVTESFFQDYENERINQENAKRNRHVFEEPKGLSYQAESHKGHHIPIEPERRLPPVRYKLTRPVQPLSDPPNPLGVLLEQMKDKCGVSTTRAHDTKLDVDQEFGKSPLKNDAKDEIAETKPARQIKSRRKTSAKEIARDLELSDETSDNFVVKKNQKEKVYTSETATHEKIQEKEVLKEKKSRKAKTEKVNSNISKLTQPTQTESLESISKKKMNNKPSRKEKSKSVSPKNKSKLEGEKAKKKINDKPDVEKAEKKTSYKPKVEKVQKGTSDKPMIEKVQQITSDKLEVEKVQRITTDVAKVEQVQKIICDKPEVEKVQKISSNKPDIEKVHKITSDNLDVEKVQKEASGKLEKENIQNISIDILDLENPARKSSDKPDEENSEKTTKGKDTKDHDKTAKFSELFGDSCSLITPEDLGVSLAPTKSAKTYVPIFEDAQDSVDVSDKMLRETEPVTVSISTSKDDQFKINVPEEKLLQDIPEVSTTEIKRKQDNVVVSIPIKITPNIDISKLKTNAPVSTVIISSGVQSVIDCNANTKLYADVCNDKLQELNIADISDGTALVTSTPFKRLLDTEVEYCDSSELSSKKDDTTSSVNQSRPSNADPQSEDVPDVRIFIRRRRRVKK